MVQLWREMQRQVCSTCTDGDHHGECRLPVDESCALRDHLAVVVDAVTASDGGSRGEQLTREAVCRACGTREADGSCWRANRLECAFDRMLPAIIHSLQARQAHPA